MKTFKKILVPTDFSDLSAAAVEYASSLSLIYDATIYLLHVVDKTPVLAFHTLDLTTEAVQEEARVKAKEELEQFAHKNLQSYNKVVSTIRLGEPYREIINFAEEEGVELIVLSTHGRTGLAHVIMGSVAEKVVRHSPVPVLTVKPEPIQEHLLKEKDIEEQLHLNWR